MEDRQDYYVKASELGLDKETVDSMVEFVKRIWNSIKDGIKNMWEKIKPFIEKLMLISKDKEFNKLTNMENKVKSKRLKKKYRNKKIAYISMKYRRQ